MLPVHIAPPVLLACGFLTGIVMDSFMDTPGMHTLATTFIAYLRIFFLRATLSKEQSDIIKQPDIASIGITGFLFYAGTFTFIHHTILFFAQAFTFHEFWACMQRIIFSSATTLLLIVLVHFLFFRVRTKE
jgi:rod shape-determining protein MreD